MAITANIPAPRPGEPRLRRRAFLAGVAAAAVARPAVAFTDYDRATHIVSAEDHAGQPVDEHLNTLIWELSTEGGGTVRLGPGTFSIGRQVRLLDGVRLVGSGQSGPDQTILHLVADAPPLTRVAGILRIKADHRSTGDRFVNGASAENLVIDGNRSQQRQDVYDEEKKYGIYVEGADVRLSKITVRNCMGYGFDPHANDRAGLRSKRVIIEDCHAHHNLKDGFTLDGQVDMIFRRNLAELNDRAGVNIVTGTTETVVSDSIVRQNGANGIVVQNDSGRLSITGCDVHENVEHGIYLRAADQVSVLNNFVHDNGLAGVRVSGGMANLISENEVAANARDHGTSHYEIEIGPYKDVNAVGTLVSRNRIRTLRNGIVREREGADRTEVIDNVYSTNAHEITLSGPNSYASQNIREAF